MKLISAQSKLLTPVIGLFFFCLHCQAQCEADHTIVMADYYFAPAELTILPGETVAFVNVQGTHDVNGITNTLTGESWGNPTSPESSTSIRASASRPSLAWSGPSPSTHSPFST
jgi:hypothetical protein